MQFITEPLLRMVGYIDSTEDLVLRFKDGQYLIGTPGRSTNEYHKSYLDVKYNDIKAFTIIADQLPTEELEYFTMMSKHICDLCDKHNEEGHLGKEGGWVCDRH